MSARQKFVKGSGIFGKYLYRGMVYFGENAIAFLGLTLTIVALFSVSHVFGLTVPMMAATASAAVSSLTVLPVLAGIVALAVAIAAPETLKKVYKECTEWVVAGYKNAVKNWFMPKNTDFDITSEQLAVKQAKHSQTETSQADWKYASLESYKEAKRTQYDAINNNKTADLDLAGKAGKRAFKAAANGIADGAEFVASLPGRAIASISMPSFTRSKATINTEANGGPLLQEQNNSHQNKVSFV